MLTIFELIEGKTESWIAQEKTNSQSVIGNLMRYIEKEGRLREPQIKAIEVYLWLKFVGQNKKLSEIIKEGILSDEDRIGQCEYYQIFAGNHTTQFLNQFAQDNGLKNLQKMLLNDAQGARIDWSNVLEELLHNFGYPSYLFSLPMGAGKTYLMACFIYLDLYCAMFNMADERFAHNFVVFAPHASKTAILPSLQTIKNFHPEWILPPEEAKPLKQIIHIEILDTLSSKRKDKLHGNNPNLEKVNRLIQTKDFGMVFITNAEKVVLERYDEKELIYINPDSIFYDEKKATDILKINELREKLSQIPYLTVILDEVHHTYGGNGNGEKKMRQAVNILNQHKKVVSVLGFSGTPFVRNSVKIGDSEIKLNQIQDIVYNYSLADGIGRFLKVPVVKSVADIKEQEFIRQALTEFFSEYDIVYADGAKSKIVFYCPSIKKLNEEILPVIQQWYQGHRPGREAEIFRYYSQVAKENKQYKLPKESLAVFNNLDKPYSDKRVILLVAVGTEGWDCKSLTAVVLPRQTTTKNFVLQTTCRCLREVEDAKKEKALIFLEPGNYDTLNRELRENYNLTIDDLKANDTLDVPVIIRKPKLGRLRYKQVYKKFEILTQKKEPDASKMLKSFDFNKIRQKYPYEIKEVTAQIGQAGLVSEVVGHVATYTAATYGFQDMVYDIARAGYGKFTETDLYKQYYNSLKSVYAQIHNNYEWLARHPSLAIQDITQHIAALLMARIEYKTEVVTDDVEIELLEWHREPAHIFYGNGKFLPNVKKDDVRRLKARPHRICEDFEDARPDPQDISFNYIPYRMDSDFERNALLELLKLKDMKDLEVYYNGYKDQELQGFYIKTNVGVYTPDFLIIKRTDGRKYKSADDKGAIDKVLILETKARPYYTEDFKQKERFVNEVFLKYNPHFRYERLIDEDGRNDFGKHINRVRELINLL